ncbi:MAG: creatininase family protein [Bacteriovoracaceae bacterium]|nr:creatininase family protein [Bacteriovoracaceae bacterium]
MDLSFELFGMPHKKMTETLKTGAPVFVLVNPVEYHGPHLSLYTDEVLSMTLARKLHERLSKTKGDFPFLLGQNLSLGAGPTPGPGSVHTPYLVLKKKIRKLCKSLVAVGAQKVIFMTFHGAPLHNMAIQSGVDYLESKGVKSLNPFNIILQKLIDYNPGDYPRTSEFINNDETKEFVKSKLNHDFHAGIFETSLCLYLCPHTVDDCYLKLKDCPELVPDKFLLGLSKASKLSGNKRLAREFEFAAIGMGWVTMKPRLGYSGRPKDASAKLGEYYAEENILPTYEKACLEGLWGSEKSPEPVMKWVKQLTLAGTIMP